MKRTIAWVVWVLILLMGTAFHGSIAVEHQYLFGFIMGCAAMGAIQVADPFEK